MRPVTNNAEPTESGPGGRTTETEISRPDTPRSQSITEFPDDDVVNVNVHLIPECFMAAIRDTLADSVRWNFDHSTDLDAMLAIREAEGVDRFFALPYIAQAGMAVNLNRWVAARGAESNWVVPFDTVHAADDDVGGF